MLIGRKMLVGAVLAVGLVGAGIGALALRSTNGNSTAATTAPDAAPAVLTDQAQKPADQLAAEKPAQENSTNVVSNGTRRQSSRYSTGGRSAYYDYGNQPRQRTFWQKHRDKLTMAGGAGAGALVGGLIGGKRGAGVGLLAGGAGSALYTYKLRHKRHRY
jgi:hypothetical protein